MMLLTNYNAYYSGAKSHCAERNPESPFDPSTDYSALLNRVRIQAIEGMFILLNADERVVIRQIIRAYSGDTTNQDGRLIKWMQSLIIENISPLVLRQNALRKLDAYLSKHDDIFSKLFENT